MATVGVANSSRYVIGLRPRSVEAVSVTVADGQEVRARLRTFPELNLGLYVAELPVATTPIQSIRFFGATGELYGSATRLASADLAPDQRGGYMGPIQLTDAGQRAHDASAAIELDAGSRP